MNNNNNSKNTTPSITSKDKRAIIKPTFHSHECGALICPYSVSPYKNEPNFELCYQTPGYYTYFACKNDQTKQFERVNITVDKFNPEETPDVFVASSRCPFRKKFDEQLEQYCDMMKANIDEVINFDDYVGDKSVTSLDCLKLMSEEPDSFLGHSIYVYGTNQTQKSSQIKALALRYVARKIPCYYTTMDDVVKTCYNLENAVNNPLMTQEELYELKRKHDLFLNTMFLFIDESFDTEKLRMYRTGTNLPALSSFLNDRIKKRDVCTVFVSNVAPDNIDVRFFGVSIKDWVLRETAGAQLLFEDIRSDAINKLNTASIFEKAKEARKIWTIVDPDGNEFKTENLNKFCKDNFKEESGSYMTNLSSRGKHKGWIAYRGNNALNRAKMFSDPYESKRL